jgi:Protein of unknown function (DUF3102)
MKTRRRTLTPTDAKDARQKWANRIHARWAKAVGAIVETGKQLIVAKDDIPYGEFHYMIHNELPFSGSTAERLMAIARHKILSQSAQARNLPAHWTTLAELSRLPPRRVVTLINDGSISPKIGRREAEVLVARELARSVRVTEVPAAPQTLRLVRVTEVPAAPQTLRLTVGNRTMREIAQGPPDPTLDDSTPSADVEPALRALAAQATEINEPPINRYGVLLAAWEAASPDDRQRFLDKIGCAKTHGGNDE